MSGIEPDDEYTPSDQETDVWSKVYWAYKKANPPNSLPMHAGELGLLAKQWKETRDTSYMDAAINYCDEQKIPILPELLEHVSAAMQKRISDGNSPKKAFRKSAKAHFFEEMAKLIYHGVTPGEAAERVAYYSHTQTSTHMKASSLEKEYPRQKEKHERFAKMFFEGPHLSEEERIEMFRKWAEAKEQKFPLTEEMKGTRR